MHLYISSSFPKLLNAITSTEGIHGIVSERVALSRVATVEPLYPHLNPIQSTCGPFTRNRIPYARGKQLITTLACLQCHKIGSENVALVPDLGHGHGLHHGGSHHAFGSNLVIGPNLEDVVKKYRGETKAVLQEILEPSRTIEEKYRKITLELEDGSILAGNVVAEERQTVTIYTAPPLAKEHKVAKSAIESRNPSALSIMPVGQLNTLDKEQILDLLAFLLAGGKADHPAFQNAH